MKNHLRIIRIGLLMISMHLSHNCFSQVDTNESRLSNDSIKYHIIRISGRFINNRKDYIPTKDVIFIHLSNEVKQYYRLLDYDQWIALLENPSTDWSINLLLYSLYVKDAVLMDKTRGEWIKSKHFGKEADLNYWKTYLKDTSNFNRMFAPDSEKKDW